MTTISCSPEGLFIISDNIYSTCLGAVTGIVLPPKEGVVVQLSTDKPQLLSFINNPVTTNSSGVFVSDYEFNNTVFPPEEATITATAGALSDSSTKDRCCCFTIAPVTIPQNPVINSPEGSFGINIFCSLAPFANQSLTLSTDDPGITITNPMTQTDANGNATVNITVQDPTPRCVTVTVQSDEQCFVPGVEFNNISINGAACP
jgi:hypothetical protein